MRILHLSDTHVSREPGPDSEGVDTRDSLRRILADCAELPGLDALVVTGDIADDGSPEAYRDVRDMVLKFVADRGIPAILTTGNHDERAAFTAALGTGHLDAGGADRPERRLDGDERAAVTTVDGHRIVTLDSLVPGKGYGLISAAQLAWLRGVLAEPAPHGTILAFHHPPVAVPGVAVQAALGLRNGDELAVAIAGSDVRLILCGHFHLQLFGMLAGVPVWVTPGVVTRIDLTATPGTERAVKGASATLVDLGGPHSPVFHTLHARDPLAGETAYEIDERELAAVIAELGPPA
ncbi:3',5'-cyclic AMP phosphodiesterase CpdA [Actinoplanes octamycinicus]|uniref:3',5'-cyclic AMP phosphodiesterase CpdA n=1 Tax=Actinoplanes octamycinicus TaxID=135948 RepID=A0A7W7H2U6_9ACTN|nr:metallophosphoesterase [Actinoplanes octamycinicus]MBB4742955.1 3',5'-cyclic AMP phosphodiesterase CpdA [Actinoplanes octamycinicus]GIE58192.1 phosphohydrolase [Actinoplanes octamycinicus]